MGMKNYQQFKRKLLKDRGIKKAYDELGPEFNLIKTIIKRRLEKGLTQKELARRIGTKQSAISRLESGTYNPTISFLEKIAKALDAKLKISLSKK